MYPFSADAHHHWRCSCRRYRLWLNRCFTHFGQPAAEYTTATEPTAPKITDKARTPVHEIAICGMDAFTHAIESYTSINASPMSEQYSIQAIRMIGKYILEAYANGDNVDARKYMSMGSLYAGFGIANAGSGAVGALSYPVEGMYQVIHGVGNSLLLPYVIAYNAIADFSKVEVMAAALDLESTSGRDATAAVVGFVKKLNETFQIPKKLSDIGSKKADLKALADDAITRQRILINNMRKLDHSDIIKIYESAW